MFTCFATPAAMRSRTRDMTPELFKPGWGIKISSTQFVILSCHRLGSKTFGGSERPIKILKIKRERFPAVKTTDSDPVELFWLLVLRLLCTFTICEPAE